METGYLHHRYASAQAEWGRPRALPRCRGWVLERPIGSGGDLDAAGCYPLFACQDWQSLTADLDALGREMVSVTAVTDPFVAATEADLRATFGDLVRPYKWHFVVDLTKRPNEFIHSHHQRNVRKAAAAVRVRYGPPTPELLSSWVVLYPHLVRRHRIQGVAAFSPASFAAQFEVPGLVVGTAEAGGEVVGMVLWYVTADRAYYHLAAYSDAGYAAGSSFALFRAGIDHFAADGLRWLSLGAGAGVTNDGTDGLNRFKRGWATGCRPTYLCGRICDSDRYRALTAAVGVTATDYFPAYRRGEFCQGDP